MSIYITGDAHGRYRPLMDRLDKKGYKLTANDILIIAGDFDFQWSMYDFHKLMACPFTIAFIDGDEDFPLSPTEPTTDWNGGKVHIQGPQNNVVHLLKGQCYTIEGKTFLAMGGLHSNKNVIYQHINDKIICNTVPSDNDEYTSAAALLEKYGYKTDYILTNLVPEEMLVSLGCNPDDHDAKLMNFLQELHSRTEYRQWFCGHFHEDYMMPDENIRLIYEDVVRID